MLSRPLTVMLAAAAVLLVACGGADYSGKVDVPKGYETVRESGVSFVRPSGFSGRDIRTGGGLHQTQFADPAVKPGEGAFVAFSTLPRARKRFETIVDDARRVMESTDADVDVDEVDVPGAEKAYRSTISKEDLRSERLEVLLRDGTFVSLTAGAPERDSDGVDSGAVVDSFRVEGAP